MGHVFTRVPFDEVWAVARDARLEFSLAVVFSAVIAWFAIASSL